LKIVADFLEDYYTVLEQHGALAPKAIKPLRDSHALDVLHTLRDTSPPPDLLAYFRRVDGYDDAVCRELDVFEPAFAWGMFCLSLAECISNHELCDEGDEDYWPSGFVPILWDGGGSYLAVNCRQFSPTWGGVYDMSEGVGCNRVSASLPDFFRASAAEIEAGLRRYGRDTSELAVGGREYLERAAPIFGQTQYFSRAGRMGDQIVDWK